MVISEFNIPTHLQQLVSTEQAYHYQIAPVAFENNTLSFKTCTKNITSLEKELKIVFGKNIILTSDSSENIQNYLEYNYRKTEVKNSVLHYSDDFLMKVIHEAKNIGSSDIHFEAFEKEARVRFRIDGKLIEHYLISVNEYPKIVNRIKILAGADISEKRLPQDGRIFIETTTENFDIRVSTLPTMHGEKIVLRLLNNSAANIQLNSLGFTELELKKYKENIQKPSGIILISGPTGSGKTTTLYATLKELNKADTNILTIEDPIEYKIKGVNQVQLKEAIGLDFSKALKTFLRQDPDIIMVGEIRDTKAANIAIRAALTGHLVLSTIHTNSSWATISRLVDMGIPSFLIASTLNMSVAQRLVRKLCKHCKKKEPLQKNLFPNHFEIPSSLEFHYTATGCSKCHHTGFFGRKAIYEILPITQSLKTHIKNNELEIETYLNQNQMPTLQDNALDLIVLGETSIAEVYPLLISV